MARFKYNSYSGSESYVLILCGAADRDTAAAVANALTERGFRVVYEVYDKSKKHEVERIADSISRSGGNLVFLSEDACSAMPYRNFINYLVRNPEPEVYCRLNNYVLSDGMDLRLANQRVFEFKDADDVIEKLISEGVVTQEMKAEPGDIKALTGRGSKKWIAAISLIMIAAALAAGTWGALRYRQSQLEAQHAEREAYYQSDEYILSRLNSSLNNAKYVNFSRYSNESLVYLEGLVIGTLDLSGCGFDDISAVGGVDVCVVNVSGNPGISTLEPLLKCPHLQKVIISKDMTDLTYIFDGTGIIVEIQ